jgi:hypothetical protein
MRLAFAFAAVATALLAAGLALGAETPLGVIYATDAGSGANAVHNKWPTDGGGFTIRPSSLLSVQCTQPSVVCIDSHVGTASRGVTCSATTGVAIPASQLFPTSCRKSSTPVVVAHPLSDGGTNPTSYTSCTVAVLPSPDAGTATTVCAVFEREGNEGP